MNALVNKGSYHHLVFKVNQNKHRWATGPGTLFCFYWLIKCDVIFSIVKLKMKKKLRDGKSIKLNAMDRKHKKYQIEMNTMILNQVSNWKCSHKIKGEGDCVRQGRFLCLFLLLLTKWYHLVCIFDWIGH